MTQLLKSLVNGKTSDTVSLRDRGFQFGDGVFETVRVINSRCLLLDRHLLRLSSALEHLGINTDLIVVLKTEIRDIIQGCTDGALKIIITRGITDLGYTYPELILPTRCLLLFRYSFRNDDPVNLGVSSIRLPKNRFLAGIKHLNRLDQVLVRKSWETGWDEAVVFDQKGRVIEGTMSNIFLVHKKTITTPKLDECGVAGVVRQWVIDRCKKEEIKIKIKRVERSLLETANEIFMTNSLQGIQTVRCYRDKEMKESQLTKQLQYWYRNDVENA